MPKYKMGTSLCLIHPSLFPEFTITDSHLLLHPEVAAVSSLINRSVALVQLDHRSNLFHDIISHAAHSVELKAPFIFHSIIFYRSLIICWITQNITLHFSAQYRPEANGISLHFVPSIFPHARGDCNMNNQTILTTRRQNASLGMVMMFRTTRAMCYFQTDLYRSLVLTWRGVQPRCSYRF